MKFLGLLTCYAKLYTVFEIGSCGLRLGTGLSDFEALGNELAITLRRGPAIKEREQRFGYRKNNKK